MICNKNMFFITARSNLQTLNHFIIRIRRQSRLQKDKVAHVVVAPYLLPNSNWLRELCGIRSASAVLNVSVHWTRHWLVMVPIRRSIAVRATLSSSVLRDSVSDILPLWCPPVANKLFNSQSCPSLHLNVNIIKRKLFRLQSRWSCFYWPQGCCWYRLLALRLPSICC